MSWTVIVISSDEEEEEEDPGSSGNKDKLSANADIVRLVRCGTDFESFGLWIPVGKHKVGG